MTVSAVSNSRRIAIVMAAAAAALGISLGVRQGWGLYIAPMTLDLGWSFEAFGLAIAIQNLLWGASQPIAGMLADRYGSGRIIGIGALLYAAGVWGMSSAVTPTMLHVTAGVLVGLGMSGVGFSIVYSAVARIVEPARRTQALATVSAMSGIGPLLLPKVSELLIAGYGWHLALVATALFSLLMALLASQLTGRSVLDAGARSQNWREALREAGFTQGYVLLTFGFFVCGFHVTFIGAHLPGFIAWCGLPLHVAGTSLALIGAANVAGSWLAGSLSRRYRQKNLLSLIYFGRAAMIALLMLMPRTEWTIYAFSAIFGLLWLSTVPLTSGLVARLFGAQHLGMLFGLVFFSHQIGAFLGAWLGGRLYDETGNYDVMWYASIALGLIAALLHWPIRDTPAERGNLAQPA
jgi:predicted MFS family arabinose efflux permease